MLSKKKARLPTSKHRPRNQKPQTTNPTPLPKKPTPPSKPSKPPKLPSLPPSPFNPHDRILLLGDGDLSFSLSLLHHHGCYRLLPTTLDTAPVLLTKYPQSAAHTAALASADITPLHGINATKLSAYKPIRRGLPPENANEGGEAAGVREGDGKWDRIVFNFPHVGGKSTDVNRQVRHNQALLVGFFASALPLLAPRGGTIHVTLFEGEPYTLWNIRDLARHVGLGVKASARFEAGAYPGYRHARTGGNVEGGGGWRGEERRARMYVFGRKEEGGAVVDGGGEGKGRKRRRGEESKSDDEG